MKTTPPPPFKSRGGDTVLDKRSYQKIDKYRAKSETECYQTVGKAACGDSDVFLKGNVFQHEPVLQITLMLVIAPDGFV